MSTEISTVTIAELTTQLRDKGVPPFANEKYCLIIESSQIENLSCEVMPIDLCSEIDRSAIEMVLEMVRSRHAENIIFIGFNGDLMVFSIEFSIEEQ